MSHQTITTDVRTFLHRPDGKVADLYKPDRRFAMLGVHDSELGYEANKARFDKLRDLIKRACYEFLTYHTGLRRDHTQCDCAQYANSDRHHTRSGGGARRCLQS